MPTCSKCWNEFKLEDVVDEQFCSVECYEQNIKEVEAFMEEYLNHAFDENGNLKPEYYETNIKKDSSYDEIL